MVRYAKPVSSPPELNQLLEGIMHINVQHMGGASAGIFGVSGADSDVVDKLKRAVVAFASEYRKPTVDRNELVRLSNEAYGYLQTLQLLNTLSEEEANELAGQLQMLTNRHPG